MKYFVFVLIVIGASPASVASAFSECAAIEDATERLDCYDNSAQKSQTREPREPAGTIGDDDPLDETLFGKRLKRTNVPDSIESRIIDVTTNNARKKVITLENGMVWIEREPSRRPIYRGQEVVIDKRKWSFSMRLVDEKRRVTVERLE
ncbi:MAG: hypothetical protein WD002_08540 [Pseudomonadales bacterium]